MQECIYEESEIDLSSLINEIEELEKLHDSNQTKMESLLTDNNNLKTINLKFSEKIELLNNRMTYIESSLIPNSVNQEIQNKCEMNIVKFKPNELINSYNPLETSIIGFFCCKKKKNPFKMY